MTASAAPVLDAMAAASPAEIQLARSLVQLRLAHLRILQTTLLDAYHHAVSALDAPAVRDLALQIVSGVSQVEHARDQIGPGEELEPLRAELDAAWQAAVSQLAVQVSPQVLGGALVTSNPEPPPRAHVVHLGAELVSREAGRVLELLEAAERIRSYVMPEGAATSEAATPGDQLLAVTELKRFSSRPIDALFLAAMLKRTGAWPELAQARGGDGRTAAQVLGNAYAQAAETGATVDLGSEWNRYCIEVARRHWQEHEWRTALTKDLRVEEAKVKAKRGEDASLSRNEVLRLVEKLRRRFDIQAPIQLQWRLVEEAQASTTSRECALDSFVRFLREVKQGWPSDLSWEGQEDVRHVLTSWQNSVKDEQYEAIANEIVDELLEATDIRPGWLPCGIDDPRLVAVFDRHWPQER